MSSIPADDLQRLLDKEAIRDTMARYSRAVDRGDWAQLRLTYHVDAWDDHGEYKGPIDGLVEWLDKRFAGVDNSIHFLGNSLIEFADPDTALVETYFVSRRLRPPTDEELAGPRDAMCREAWGRYIDRFERRDGQWRVARRIVVLESSSTSLALGGVRGGTSTWGHRDRDDPLYQAQLELFGRRRSSAD
jgi:hypothetical protein